MEKTGYSWETTFETSKGLMIHTFTDRVKVVSNIQTGTVKVLKDGEVINNIENPAITEYDKFLLQVAKDANELEKFKKD